MRRTFRAVMALVIFFAMLAVTAPAVASSYPSTVPQFEEVWEKADGPVSRGEVSRSWLWGPHARAVAYEPYVDVPLSSAGLRFVQYFDKGRLEENDPSRDPTDPWRITSGLLVREMVSGMVQVGDNEFRQREPAHVPVAADLNSTITPTFADFSPYSTTDGESNRVGDRTGAVVDTWMSVGGQLSTADGPVPVALVAFMEATGHNIPDVFWNWMHDPNTGVADNPTGNWLYTTGYPISEPYWIVAPLAGVPTPMLVQLFERRAVTYTPTNDPAWRIEMGNVGLQHLEWLKPLTNAQVTWSPESSRVAFVTNPQGNWEIAVADLRGGSRVLSYYPYDETDPRWLTNNTIAFTDSRDGASFVYNVDDGSATRMNVLFPVVSPDGRNMAYFDLDGLLHVTVDDVDRFIDGQGFPVAYGMEWSSDSTTLLYTRSVLVDKGFYIDVVFTYDVESSQSTQVFPRQSKEAAWGDSGRFLYDHSVSPDGGRVALNIIGEASSSLEVVEVQGDSEPSVVDIGMNAIGVDWGLSGWIAFRGANGAIWMIEGSDPSTILPVSVAPTSDWDPQWSPDGQWIAFERQSGRGNEVWTVNPFTPEWHRVAEIPVRP